MNRDYDYYQILQVLPEADVEIIQAAYRALARKYHPDSSGVRATGEKMKVINEAYHVLADADSRAVYDWDRRKTYGSQDTSQQRTQREQQERMEQARRDAERSAAIAEQARQDAERKAALAQQAQRDAETKGVLAEKARQEAEREIATAKQARREAERKVALAQQAQQAAERRAARAEQARQDREREVAAQTDWIESDMKRRAADAEFHQFLLRRTAAELNRFIIWSTVLATIGVVMTFLVFPLSRAELYWPTLIVALVLKALYVYRVYGFAQTLQNQAVVVYGYCAVALIDLLCIASFVGLCIQAQNRIGVTPPHK